jgi:Rrf2 family cysteine metabolism transcriptional repressor
LDCLDNTQVNCYDIKKPTCLLGIGGVELKLSTRGEYGLRAMFDLALRYGEGPIPLKSISKRQDISSNYLEQLISVLRKSGLVKSVRGSQGGYLLNKEPMEITVGDIIRVLEGPIAPVDCLSDADTDLCYRAESCIARSVWKKVKDSINDVIDSITLEDMVQESKSIKYENSM